MRFGQNYHRLQIPLWSSFYFNYNAYKSRIRNASVRQLESEKETQYKEIINALSNEIDAFISFCSKEYKTIQISQTDLFNLEATFNDSHGIISLYQLDQEELKDFLISFTELRVDILNLLWFIKVEEDGLRKIHAKVQRAHRDKYGITESIKANLLKVDSYLAVRLQCFSAIKRIDNSTRNLNNILLSKRTEKPQLSLHLHFYLGEICSVESLRSLQDAIRDDDAYSLESLSSQANLSQISPKRLLRPLLLLSLFNRSRLCFQLLLTRLEKLGDEDSLHGCIIHRLTILTARRVTLAAKTSKENADQEYFASENFIKCILEQLKDDQRSCLYRRDSRGRLPIHYASKYGHSHICQLLSDHMFDSSTDVTLYRDFDGASPLSLAIAGGHVEAVQVLLRMRRNQNGKTEFCLLPGDLLEIALNSEYPDIIASLLAAGIDKTYKNGIGETLIYIAARSAHQDSLTHLLQDDCCRTDYLNSPEFTSGRTPLMVASLIGDVAIAEILIKAGANIDAVDYFSWSASEIAAYRGHIEVLRTLEASKHVTDSLAERTLMNRESLKGLPLIGNYREPEHATSKQAKVDDEKDEAQLFVNLGPLDPKNSSTAVELSSYNSLDGVSPQTSTVFALEISIIGSISASSAITLPILEEDTNDPCCFSVPNRDNIIISIKVFHLDACVGNGNALISDLGQKLKLDRQNLARDFTIPIMETKSSRLIGTVTCTAIITTPKKPTNRLCKAVSDIWRTQPNTKVVGHRGFGENFDKHDYLQIKENSIQSLKSAINMGASALEFDVQVTKDHIPVLYHDFRMSETRIDAPVHSVTYEQLLSLNRVKMISGILSNAPTNIHLKGHVSHVRQRRSRSMSPKPTIDNSLQGIKKHRKNDLVEEPFVILEEILQQIPESVPFDVELKYPMRSEAIARNMETTALELNVFVDTILDKLYAYGGSREIIISSFSPEICITLQAKQQIYPVCFLTDAGLIRYGDVRASSLQNAIHFAKRWNLHGIIVEARPLVICPQLIKLVKGHGLFCASFGGVNNDPKSAKIQVDAGLDVLIVDRVNVIVDSLNRGGLK